MVDLLHSRFGVQRVAFIGSADTYGRTGEASFLAAAAARGEPTQQHQISHPSISTSSSFYIECTVHHPPYHPPLFTGMRVIASIPILASPSNASLDDMVAQLIDADARVIALFCGSELAGQILVHSYQAELSQPAVEAKSLSTPCCPTHIASPLSPRATWHLAPFPYPSPLPLPFSHLLIP